MADSPGQYSPSELAILARIKQSESGGDYTLLAGGAQHFSGDQFPQWGGFLHSYQGKMVRSHGAGAYQFEPDTFAGEANRLGLADFSPSAQDTAALDLAKRTYAENTGGRDIVADQQDERVNWAALAPQWDIGGAEASPVTRADWLKSSGLLNPVQVQKPPTLQQTAAVPTQISANANPPAMTGMALALLGAAAKHQFVPVEYDPFKVQAQQQINPPSHALIPIEHNPFEELT